MTAQQDNGNSLGSLFGNLASVGADIAGQYVNRKLNPAQNQELRREDNFENGERAKLATQSENKRLLVIGGAVVVGAIAVAFLIHKGGK